MRAAILHGKEDLRLEEVERPRPAPGEVVVRVRAATTCGTDLKVWLRGGHARMIQPPAPFGHEFAGEVAELGEGVTAFATGDRIVANNSVPCGSCFFCRKDQPNLCEQIAFVNGTYAEYLLLPAAHVSRAAIRIPDGVPFETASLSEPLACVLWGLENTPVTRGDELVILGDGPIGLMFAAEAVLTGATVRVIGGSDSRLACARRIGAAETYNYHQQPDTVALVKKRCNGGRGPDLVVEATGKPGAWNEAVDLVRTGGRVNLFGGCPKGTAVSFDTERIHYGQVSLHGVFHNTPETFRRALERLASGGFPVREILSEERPLPELAAAFDRMRRREVVKVVIRP